MATFRLRRQTSRWALFAEVIVQAEQADEYQAVLGTDVYAWRRSIYGPNAFFGGAYDEELCSAASDGARYALRHLPESAAKTRIRIVEIVESMADTTAEAVKFATAHAVWTVLGLEPDSPPWIDQEGNAHFPD